MVEMLVASTILTILVMMLSMLFQSTGIAWRTGVQRADTFMEVRGFFGALQRDLSNAIDEREVPEILRSGKPQRFDSTSLAFFTATGTGFKENTSTPYRALRYITYNTNGERTEQRLIASSSASWDSAISYNVMTSASIERFEAIYASGSGTAGLPVFINIKAKVTSSGYTLEIGAGSAGPDRQWETKDDITTWK